MEESIRIQGELRAQVEEHEGSLTEAWQSLETEKHERSWPAQAGCRCSARSTQAKFARSQEEESVLNQQLQSQSAEKLEKEVLDLLEQLEGQAALTEALSQAQASVMALEATCQGQAAALEASQATHEEALTEAHTVQENLKEKLTLLEEQISASSATSTELHEKLGTITATLRETESVKESAQKALETLQSEKEALETELARLEAERILPEQLETLATEKQQVESALEEERSALAAARTSLESLQKESDDLRETLSATNTARTHAESEANELRTALQMGQENTQLLNLHQPSFDCGTTRVGACAKGRGPKALETRGREGLSWKAALRKWSSKRGRS